MMSGNYCFTTANDYVISYGFANMGYVYSEPVSGFSIVVPPNVYDVILNPTGLLLSGTIQLPATIQDGKLIEICSSKAITLINITCAAGDTIVGASLTSMILSNSAIYKYILAKKMWFRKQ